MSRGRKKRELIVHNSFSLLLLSKLMFHRRSYLKKKIKKKILDLMA